MFGRHRWKFLKQKDGTLEKYALDCRKTFKRWISRAHERIDQKKSGNLELQGENNQRTSMLTNPHSALNSVRAIAISGLWLGSLYTFGRILCSKLASSLSG